MIALDLFAGTGWGVACKRLGVEEKGVELMAEAVATRLANGMETIYRDVWDGLLLSRSEHARLYGIYNILIASPPCQTFSVAGHGAGRKALDEVIEAIQLHAYKNPELLREFGEKHDIRTALVLSPLAYIYRDMPQYVALEQVTTVLPVWEAYAEVMRDLGYSVKTAILNSEQYGVPQTRRRAILVARLDGPVSLPTPTHSRYYTRTPEKLDAGVLPWVSMAEALGWAPLRPEIEGWKWKDAPATTVAGDPRITAREHHYHGEQNSTSLRITVEEAHALQTYPVAATKVETKGRTEKYGKRPDRPTDAPAFTVVGHDGHPRGGFQFENADGTTRRATVEELATLQTYPVFTQNNKLAHQARRPLSHPAPTVTAGHDSGNRGFIDAEGEFTKATVEQVAALQSYPVAARKNMGKGMVERHGDRPARSADDPAFTIRASAGGTEPGGFILENEDGSTRKLTAEEAATIQSYPVFRNGNQANSAKRTPDQPAPTIHFGARSNKVEWMDADKAADPAASGQRVTVEEAATLQSYPAMLRSNYSTHGDPENRGERTAQQPAPTLTSKANRNKWDGETGMEPTEASALQSYEPPFEWCGSRTKQFLQIGNAVPPLMAQAILTALIAPPTKRRRRIARKLI